MEVKNIYKLIFRIVLLASVLVGVLLSCFLDNNFLIQICYFTIQTNIFIGVLATVLIIITVKQILNKTTNLEGKRWFSVLRLGLTFFISVTGLVYCFVLAPVSCITNPDTIYKIFSVHNILLHVVTPVMAIIDYFLFAPKGNVKLRDSFYFLIYPLIYFAFINIRAILGGANISENSPYPYFFIDPTYNNQGWGMVALYFALMLLFLLILSMLLIYLDKQKYKKQLIKKSIN